MTGAEPAGTGDEEGSQVEGATHDLLLALAGRVDDDLLGWARELVALGEDARAVEMLTASLVAARAVLPAATRSALVAAARSARTDLGPAAALPPPRPDDGSGHRFAAPAEDDPVAAALLDLPARPLAGCRVLLVRRLTPAGSAPGPLPHPVVLVQVRAGTRPADVLAYQLAAALERAGAPASVEVLPADVPLPAYHAAALEQAIELRAEDGAERSGRPRRDADTAVLPASPAQRPADEPAVRPSPGDARPAEEGEPAPKPLARRRPPAPVPQRPEDEAAAEPHASDDPAGVEATGRLLPARRPVPDPAPEPADAATGQFPVDPADHVEDVEPLDDGAPHPLAAPRPAPDGARPAPRPTPPARPRPTVGPLSRAVPPPIPLVRRDGPSPLPRPVPVTEPRPVVRRVEDDRPADAPVGKAPAGPETRPERLETSAFDSLSDPLSAPLHGPLLAPLLDPTVLGEPPAPRRGPEDEPVAQADDEWSQEWLSGTWAMAPSALEERRDDRRVDGGDHDDDRDDTRHDDESRDDDPRDHDTRDGDDDRGDRDEDRDDRDEDRDDRDEDVAPAPRRPARHRYAEEPDPVDGDPDGDLRVDQPDDDLHDDDFHDDEDPDHDDHGRGPQVPPGGSTATTDRDGVPGEDSDGGPGNLGLRPESLARLSDADRRLLARLQAELLEGRNARTGRRSGITGSPSTNGSHRTGPPDLAG